LEPRDLQLLRLHLPVAGEGMLGILRELLRPVPQLRLMHAQVLRGLRIRHASISDQAYSLKLELPRKLPTLHDPPPVPLSHQTWCLRNRVQAMGPTSYKASRRARMIVRFACSAALNPMKSTAVSFFDRRNSHRPSFLYCLCR